jgi:hypothetical protein
VGRQQKNGVATALGVDGEKETKVLIAREASQ